MEHDLQQARRRAKERLRAARRGELVLREDREPRLADAQRSVANELGFPSWPALVAHVEATGGARAERAARLVAEALAGRPDRAERLLAADPALARAGLDVALVLGDADAVAAALAADPGLVDRELPGPGRKPLSCACHSAFLAPDQPRVAGVRRVVELLLEHEARDRDGLTASSDAARRGDETLMAVLAGAGAPTEADPVAAWLGAVVRGDADAAARPVVGPSGWRRADAELLPMLAGAGEDAVVERLLAAGVPLHSRGTDEGTALHYAGLWGRASTVELLLARGAEPNLMAGPAEHPGTALAWTAFGSRALDGEGERVEGYVGAARALLAAGASVTAGMVEAAADDVAMLLEEIEPRDERVHELGPVLVRVRCRGGRCEVDDRGWAVGTAGRPPGWRDAAERTVAELGWNVARTGTVFVAAAADRDVDDLVRRTADAALAVRDAILALEE